MDAALSKALKKRDELRSELRRVEIFIEMYSELAGTEPEDHETVIAPRRDDATGQFTRERGRPKEIARFIMAILEDELRPMTRTQLVEELEARGHVIPAQDKARYVGTVLWRHRRAFINLDKAGYWLRSKACAAAEYRPDLNDPLLSRTG